MREEFRARGHDAWSCDILESRVPGPHLRGSILEHKTLHAGWDLMIAHPDCTFLTVSANAYADEDWRIEARLSALHFVRSLWLAPIPRVVIENPIGVLSTFWRRPNQIIQPWQFGDDASKATCLWFRGVGMKPLQPTCILPGGHRARRANQTASGQNRLSPSPTRKRDRAVTYPGIARAMAEQWGAIL